MTPDTSSQDDLIRYNKERWEELARAEVEFSIPFLDLTPEEARARLERSAVGEVSGKRVLCLAASGGQQSALFGLCGAHVTVFDLSETQLQRDRETADFYGYAVETQQGDMRDLSCFDDNAFDLVYQAYSINFVPSVAPVFREVARVLRPGGLYRITFANPFTMAVDDEAWDGETYLLSHPYIDGFEVSTLFPDWEIVDAGGGWRKVPSPREFRHALGTVVDELVQNQFVIARLREDVGNNPDPESGTWAHFKSVAAPYLRLWATYRPDVKI